MNSWLDAGAAASQTVTCVGMMKGHMDTHRPTKHRANSPRVSRNGAISCPSWDSERYNRKLSTATATGTGDSQSMVGRLNQRVK